MANLLQVAQLGHPVLRKKSKLVKNISDLEIQKLIDDMLATVMDVDGVGIAAAQVFQPVRIFIMASHPNVRYPYAPLMEPTAIINPEITNHSVETETDWEGCLSLPGVRALVPRWSKIEVSYFTRDGAKVLTEYEGFLARIFQHENDHLDGLVFLDRIESTKNVYMEKEFLKIIAKSANKTK